MLKKNFFCNNEIESHKIIRKNDKYSLIYNIKWNKIYLITNNSILIGSVLNNAIQKIPDEEKQYWINKNYEILNEETYIMNNIHKYIDF